MQDRVQKFQHIMERFRRGDFGNEPLTLYEILSRADEPNLINEMTPDELKASGLPSKILVAALYSKGYG